MGKLIVIEGTDGSGKSTQFRLLSQRLEREGRDFRHIVFPRYDQPSSALLKMYLNGDFGFDPASVNPYAASAFYAVDRFCSYRLDWGEYYRGGGMVLSDRYTTSNAVHQAVKVTGQERQTFLEWLYDFEYRRLELPRPDLTLYLDVPTAFTEKLLRRREADTHTHADIHEQDGTYLAACRECGREAAGYYGWTVVECVKNGAMRSVEDIHREIYSHVLTCLEE